MLSFELIYLDIYINHHHQPRAHHIHHLGRTDGVDVFRQIKLSVGEKKSKVVGKTPAQNIAKATTHHILCHHLFIVLSSVVIFVLYCDCCMIATWN